MDIHWIIQSVAGSSSADYMRIVGISDEHAEWSFDQTGENGGGGAELVVPAGVALNLMEIQFLWRGMSLVIFKDPASGRWHDASGERVDALDMLNRLNAPSEFDEYLNALLTMDWYNGELQAFYESKAFHKPDEYGPGTAHPFHRKRQPFHYMGSSWGWDVYTIGLYVTWTLIWIAAAGLIVLSFWIDRRNPSRKKSAATLPA